MGYAWKGKCWPDTGTALNAFIVDAVEIDPTGVNTFNSLPTINASGVISWSISNRQLNSNTTSTRTGTTQLPSCTQFADNKLELIAVQDVISAIGIGLAFVVGIAAGYMR